MRILLAEDDAEIVDFIERGLGDLGHALVQVTNGADALHTGATPGFDAIILDRMLPQMEGLEVLRRLREREVATPVLVLTAKGGVADRVDGLNAGADDYLVKPFAMAELVARLNALVRRAPLSTAVTRLEVGDITLDKLRRDVVRAGRPVHLQPREFALLEVLMRNAGRIVTRTMFLEEVWGFHFDPQTNIVESHLSRLRAKVREGFADDLIETVRGAGYRMRSDG
ncbi:response regulator transcription factor [Sphingomonas sp. GC_Shp_3]|uniref:response regulator transcription factor n=1 Tax=Sphingomonas sp. GC_Shp_3 TaxID=2937383 RepID=UPI00226999CB|nr:response regulator transcription factor [Sphingomonas sp. GC_Shp_3]